MNKIDSFQGKYYFLSNFYETPVTHDGIAYKNNEAAFQAQKTLDMKKRLEFASLNASEAKKLGRQVSLRPDWEKVKVQVMKDVVYAKFSQHKELADKLISTEDAYLEEGNDWGDRVWGTVDGAGANLLGQILMDTRKILIKEKTAEYGEHEER